MTAIDKSKLDKNELAYIRSAEIQRRAQLIVKRNQIPLEDALELSEKGISAEMGLQQLSLPIDASSHTVYRIYYRRMDETSDSEYRLVDAVVEGKLYDWPSTHTVLAEIIRNRFDPRCGVVVVFHPGDDPDADRRSGVRDPDEPLDEFTRRRRIAVLEEQLRALKDHCF